MKGAGIQLQRRWLKGLSDVPAYQDVRHTSCGMCMPTMLCTGEPEGSGFKVESSGKIAMLEMMMQVRRVGLRCRMFAAVARGQTCSG